MKKAIIVSLLVGVLALGSIGAAFATGMNISGVNSLSRGTNAVAQVNTDYVGYLSNSNGVYAVRLSFNQDLKASSSIWVQLRKTDNTVVTSGYLQLTASLSMANQVTVYTAPITPAQFTMITRVVVSVSER